MPECRVRIMSRYIGPQLVGALRTDLRDADMMALREKAKARYNVRIVEMVSNTIHDAPNVTVRSS